MAEDKVVSLMFDRNLLASIVVVAAIDSDVECNKVCQVPCPVRTLSTTESLGPVSPYLGQGEHPSYAIMIRALKLEEKLFSFL